MQPRPGYVDEKAAIGRRLARIEGQVRGIARMVDDDRYCIDVLTQIAAVETALGAVASKLLSSHVEHCVADAIASGDKEHAAQKTVELLTAVERFTKTH